MMIKVIAQAFFLLLVPTIYSQCEKQTKSTHAVKRSIRLKKLSGSISTNGMKVIRDKAIEEEIQLTAVRESCSNANKLSPCACMEVMSGEIRHEKSNGGRVVALQYPEFSCDEEANDLRKKMGKIPGGFVCKQMMRKRTIHRDVFGESISEVVRYKASCELRCTTPDCASPHRQQYKQQQQH